MYLALKFQKVMTQNDVKSLSETWVKNSSLKRRFEYVSFWTKQRTVSKYLIYCLNTDVDLITTPSQPAFTCSKLSMETLEQGVSVVNFE